MCFVGTGVLALAIRPVSGLRFSAVSSNRKLAGPAVVVVHDDGPFEIAAATRTPLAEIVRRSLAILVLSR